MGKFICDYCGKTFERVGNKRYKYCFCCKQCEAEFRKGKLTHPKKRNEIIIKDKYAIIKIQNNVPLTFIKKQLIPTNITNIYIIKKLKNQGI